MSNQTLSTLFPSRLVLENVPRVHFYEGGERCPEDLTQPSCLRSILEFLGEKDYGCRHCLAQNTGCKIMCTYSLLVGVSGTGSFISWKEGWHGDNVAAFFMSADPWAPDRHSFDALGFEFEVIDKEDGKADESLFRQRIYESIQKGLPVLAYGIIGPPEACLITGYDEGGDVLIGWNFFQNIPPFAAGVEYEPSGYFRKRGWFNDISALLPITGRKEKPPLKEIYHQALKWALEVARNPMVKPGADAPERYRSRHNGLAAYKAWAEQLLHDEDFPAGDESILRQHYDVHNNVVGLVAEARWYGSRFLIEATDHAHYAVTEDLLHAAALYAGEHDLMWKLWDLAGGIDNPEGFRKFADPAIRRQMVPVILQSRDKDAEAIGYIERALEKWMD